MGMDLSYWKYKEGTDLSPREVYQTACCDGLPAEGLVELPIEAILAEIETAYAKWERMDQATWEKETGGGFQLFTTPRSSGWTATAFPGRKWRGFPRG